MSEPRHHRVQFGIRHLLLTTASVAVVVGVSVPLMRNWGSDQWGRLVQIGTSVVLGIVLVTPIGILARAQVRKSLGQQRWVLRQTWGWNSTVPFVFVAGAWIGLVVAPIALVVLITFHRADFPAWFGALQPLLAAVPVFLVTQALVRTARLTVGDHGISINFNFTAWKDIQCSYDPGGKPVPLLLKLDRHVVQLHPAQEEEREIADYLLARCRPWDGPDRPNPRTNGKTMGAE